jgi:transcriptional regulator with XRE-family HTH domain
MAVSEHNAMPRARNTKQRIEINEMLGQRLAQLRRTRGMTQRELAEKLEIGQPLVSHYERGRAGLDARLVIKLADVLRVTSDELLGLKQPKDNAKVMRPFLRRLQKVERLGRRDQQALLRTIDAFLSKAS